MKKIIFQNKKILSFLILFLLIIILTLKTNFFKNLVNILKFNESVRIKKIQLINFIERNVFIKTCGLMIPKATSTAVTIERKISTPQIFWTLDLNLIIPLKISNL